MFKRASNHYGETPPPETPYMRAQQLWDERIGAARVQAANWRYAAFASLAVAGVSCGGLIWQSSRSIVTPYIVEIDGEGAVRNIGPASEAYKPSDAVIAYALANFIRDVRSVSIDPVIVRANWLKAYDYATDRAALTLNDYARDNDPFAKIGRRSVSIEITSVVRASPTSFQLRWREKAFENGSLAGTESYTGVLTIVAKPPRDAATLKANPLGIYVNAINWSRELDLPNPPKPSGVAP